MSKKENKFIFQGIEPATIEGEAVKAKPPLPRSFGILVRIEILLDDIPNCEDCHGYRFHDICM
jgi:hypothetical protein